MTETPQERRQVSEILKRPEVRRVSDRHLKFILIVLVVMNILLMGVMVNAAFTDWSLWKTPQPELQLAPDRHGESR